MYELYKLGKHSNEQNFKYLATCKFKTMKFSGSKNYYTPAIMTRLFQTIKY